MASGPSVAFPDHEYRDFTSLAASSCLLTVFFQKMNVGIRAWEATSPGRLEFRSGEPPKSRIRVGFGFRVSGFGFRRLKPTFAVGFGFRVSGFVAWNQLSLSVSGFGFRVSSIETHFRCRFRVSGFGFRSSKPTLTVGFGFRFSGFDRPWGS